MSKVITLIKLVITYCPLRALLSDPEYKHLLEMNNASIGWSVGLTFAFERTSKPLKLGKQRVAVITEKHTLDFIQQVT